jgi:hypothetical protein
VGDWARFFFVRSYFKVWFTDDGVLHEHEPSGFSLSPTSANRVFALAAWGDSLAHLTHGLRKQRAVQFMNEVLAALRFDPSHPDGKLDAAFIISFFALEDFDTAIENNPNGD